MCSVRPKRLDDVTGDDHESWKGDALALAHVIVTSDMRKSQASLCLQGLPDGCWRSGRAYECDLVTVCLSWKILPAVRRRGPAFYYHFLQQRDAHVRVAAADRQFSQPKGGEEMSPGDHVLLSAGESGNVPQEAT